MFFIDLEIWVLSLIAGDERREEEEEEEGDQMITCTADFLFL